MTKSVLSSAITRSTQILKLSRLGVNGILIRAEAPDKATYIEIGFERGDAVSIDGVEMSPATILTKLNELGGANGIGRLDLLENRYVGMKSRGVYETPGGTILLMAHRGIEQITMDKGASHLKDELMPKYAELVYNGYWYSPEREMLQAAIDKSQELVTGTVRLKLYKGNVDIVGRKSPYSLYSQEHVTFEEDDVYDQADAGGFIKINALRLRLLKKHKIPVAIPNMKIMAGEVLAFCITSPSASRLGPFTALPLGGLAGFSLRPRLSLKRDIFFGGAISSVLGIRPGGGMNICVGGVCGAACA